MVCPIYSICMSKYFPRYDTMKIHIILFSLFLLIPILLYSLDASTFFDTLETNNIECILNEIDLNSNTSPKEILEFFQEIQEICEMRYNTSISLAQLKQNIFYICKKNILNLEYLSSIETFFNEVFSSKEETLYAYCISNKRQGKIFENKDIAVSVLIGCVEIGCGSLLWITPFRTIGSFLICDGCRRMFNEVESVEKARNSNHNRFQKLSISDTIFYKL